MIALWSACVSEEPAPAPAPYDEATPCVADVRAAFDALPVAGEQSWIDDAAVFAGEDRWRYTLTVDNGLGIDNHFQGVARLGDHGFLSGGDLLRVRPDVVVLDLRAARAVGVLDLDAGIEWHAGGVAILDTVLAVPTENLSDEVGPRVSSVRFLDVARPARPLPLPSLARGSITHAVGLARHDGGTVLACWDDEALDLYRSEGGPADGFAAEPFATAFAADATSEVDDAGDPGVHGQSVALLEQCDGALYALFADDTSPLPVDGGTDFVDLFEVGFEGDRATLHKVGSRALDCPADQGCNFAAAGGVRVDPDGGLSFLSAPHFRDGELERTSLVEFSPE